MKKLYIDNFVSGLKNNQPYAFSRWGDGEMLPAMGLRLDTINADGCKMTKTLGNQLCQVVTDDNPYWHGLLTIANKECGRDTIKNFLASNTENSNNWYRGDDLLDSMLSGHFKPLIEQIRKRRVLYIGGEHLKSLNDKFFEYQAFITVPEIDAWKKREIHCRNGENCY